MYKEALRTVWAEIDLDALRYNIRNIKAKAGEGRKLYGVIKADAYGHGAIECAHILQEEGIHAFAIATLHEAIELRQAGIRDEILCLGLTPDVNADTIIQYDITPVVDDFSAAKALSDAASDSNAVGVPKTVRCVLAADTGMGRIGWLCNTKKAVAAAVREIKRSTSCHTSRSPASSRTSRQRMQRTKHSQNSSLSGSAPLSVPLKRQGSRCR